MAADSPPTGGGIDDVFPAWWKNNIRAHPALSPADGGGGATEAKQEAAPRRLSSESTAPTPQRGARRASTSRLR
jgi:isopentenyldiphosphate isomerase